MKEHFIPVFYLKKWCSNKKLHCFSYKNGKIVLDHKSASNTGFGYNIYSRIENGQRENSTEKEHYSKIDNDASSALNALLDDSTRYNNEPSIREPFLSFFISLLVRHPIIIETSKLRGQKIFDDLIENRPSKHSESDLI